MGVMVSALMIVTWLGFITVAVLNERRHGKQRPPLAAQVQDAEQEVLNRQRKVWYSYCNTCSKNTSVNDRSSHLAVVGWTWIYSWWAYQNPNSYDSTNKSYRAMFSPIKISLNIITTLTLLPHSKLYMQHCLCPGYRGKCQVAELTPGFSETQSLTLFARK